MGMDQRIYCRKECSNVIKPRFKRQDRKNQEEEIKKKSGRKRQQDISAERVEAENDSNQSNQA